MIRSFINFLLFPPSLKTIDNIVSDQSYFRFWSLINEVDYFPTKIWQMLPKSLAYRIVILPLYIWHMMQLTKVAATSKRAKELGRSQINLYCLVLSKILNNPGLMPEEYFLNQLHLPENQEFAKHTFENQQLIFLMDLATMDRPEGDKILKTANNKRNFHDLVLENGLTPIPIIAVFGRKIEWLQPDKILPRQDLFLKPCNESMSIGASIVSFDCKTNTYCIKKPQQDFPEETGFPGYPSEAMTEDELIKCLEKLGLIKSLILQPKISCSSYLSEFTGSTHLLTSRVMTIKKLGSSPVLFHSFLKMPATKTGTDCYVTGGISAYVDANTGQISGARTMNDPETLIIHPESNKLFSEIQLPFYQEIFAACCKMHEALAAIDDHLVPIVGFDIAVTDEGFLFVEANAPCGMECQAQTAQVEPFGTDERIQNCIKSYLAPLKRYYPIHPNPVLRRKRCNAKLSLAKQIFVK